MKQKLKNLYYRAYARFLRLFLPVLVVCSVIGLSCLPALAVAPPGTANNILSFKTSVHTEGDAAIISGTIPLTNAQTRQQVITSKIVTYSHTFNKAWFHWDPSLTSMKAGSYLRSEIFPLGYFTEKNASNLNKTISLAGLPNGTQFSLDARIGGIGFLEDFEVTYPGVYYQVSILYIDADGNTLTSQIGNTEYHYDTENGPMIYTSFTIEAPSDAVAFRIQYKNQVRIINYDPEFVYEDGVHLLTFRYIVNKLEYETAFNQFNSDKLTNGIDRIEGTLNDAFHTEIAPDPDIPNQDIVQDVEREETQLRNEALNALDGFAYIKNEADWGIQATYGTALLALSTLIDSVIDELPGLRTLIYISLGLGLSAFTLSIATTVFSSYSPKNKKE